MSTGSLVHETHKVARLAPCQGTCATVGVAPSAVVCEDRELTRTITASSIYSRTITASTGEGPLTSKSEFATANRVHGLSGV